MMFLGIVKLDFPTVEMDEDNEKIEGENDKVEETTDIDAIDVKTEVEVEAEIESRGESVENEVDGVEKEVKSEVLESESGSESESTLSEATTQVAEPEPKAESMEESDPIPVMTEIKAVAGIKSNVEGKKNAKKVTQGARNILNGPWSFGAKGKGAEAWGLGTEMNSLRHDLAESCAERER